MKEVTAPTLAEVKNLVGREIETSRNGKSFTCKITAFGITTIGVQLYQVNERKELSVMLVSYDFINRLNSGDSVYMNGFTYSIN